MQDNDELLLSRIVSIDSVFPGEARLTDFVISYLKENGFKVSVQTVEGNRRNVFAEKGPGKKKLLFYGHLDTVPAYGRWRTNPTKATRIGDRMYGLGACDMKGGVAAILSAAAAAERGSVKLLFCPDEENISKGAWKAVGKRRGWFRGVELVVSGEPGTSPKGIGGTGIVTLGRRGRIVISVDITGVSSHGARPETGVSAIDQAAKMINCIGEIPLGGHRIGRESLFVRKLESASTSLSVPENAHLEIDLHIVPPTTAASAKARIETWVASLRRRGVIDRRAAVKVYLRRRETPYMEPYADDLGNRLLGRAISIAWKGERKPKTNYGSSVADDNIFATRLGVPVIVVGPKGANIHSGNEWVSVSSYRKLISAYRRLIESL